MKKWMYLVCTLSLFILITGCGAKETTNNKENNAQIKSQAKSDDENKGENDASAPNNPKENINVTKNTEQGNQTASKNEDTPKGSKQSKGTLKVHPKLENYEAMKEFLMNDEIFGMYYYEAQGENYNDDHYVLRHFDFTEDGELDTVIIPYTDESHYRTVVFMTLENDQYKYYLTDVRASEDTEFYYEDGFIIKESHGHCNLSKPFSMEDVRFIRNTSGSFLKDSVVEEVYALCPDTKYKTVEKMTKLDGLKSYQTEYKKFFYDEKSKEHLVRHLVVQYDYDMDSQEHVQKEVKNVENDINHIILDNLIIGNNTDLQTFDKTLSETNSLKKVIDYYLTNRQKFDKESRGKYIEDTLDYISSFSKYYQAEVYDEVIQDACIASVSLYGDPNPIPEAAEELFKIVKTMYVDNGENIDVNNILDFPSYTITCVDPTYTLKIRMLKYDKAVLGSEGGMGYLARDDEYVDVVFDNGENVIKQCKDIVYPTILIQNLTQLNELNDRAIWKTHVVIIPEKIVNHNEVVNDDFPTLAKLTSETLYSIDEEMFIDYLQHYLVIIPQQDSVNESENKQTFNMSDTGNERALQFTVHGSLEDITLTYTSNSMDETIQPIVKEIGSMTNSKVIVNALMDTDAAYVKVKGKYYYDMGDFEEIEFTLDSMRDASSYEVITR